MSAVGCGSTIRSSCGRIATSGRASTSAGCPITPSTTAVTTRSDARDARSRARAAKDAGRDPRRPSAGSTSPEDAMDPLVVLFGLGVGILVGLTGIGGGSLMTPLLVLFAGIHPVVAIGTDLAYGAVTKTVGGWRLLRRGTVDVGVSTWLAAGSVPGSLLGVVLVDRLHERYGAGLDDVLLAGIAAALVVVGVSILGRALFMPALVAREQHAVALTPATRAAAVAIGLVLGLLVG